MPSIQKSGQNNHQTRAPQPAKRGDSFDSKGDKWRLKGTSALFWAEEKLKLYIAGNEREEQFNRCSGELRRRTIDLALKESITTPEHPLIIRNPTRHCFNCLNRSHHLLRGMLNLNWFAFQKSRNTWSPEGRCITQRLNITGGISRHWKRQMFFMTKRKKYPMNFFSRKGFPWRRCKDFTRTKLLLA